MKTAWRGDPVAPDDYDDIVQVTRTARKAKDRTVDFEWEFTRDELLQLRQAVFHWGKGVTGRFKRFHSRVLAAINEALGEPDSNYQIPPFRDHKEDCECRVQRLDASDSYFFRGFATFASIYGYGAASTSPDEGITTRLGSSLRSKLLAALAQLGWDMERMRDERLIGASYAVYGLTWDESSGPPPMSEEVLEIDLRFHGPFAVTSGDDAQSLFEEPVGNEGGIYLWAFPVEGAHWVAYVGETWASFRERLSQHLAALFAGQYVIHDVDELLSGKVKRRVWSAGADYPSALPSFLDEYEAIAPRIKSYVANLRFHVAPLRESKHVLRQVESLLGRHYEAHPDRRLSDFFGAGGRWARPVPYTKPIRLSITSEAKIEGLPTVLDQSNA